MKMFAALSLLVLSVSAFALEHSAKADFTSLYNGFNAGAYKVNVKLVSKPSLSKSEITTLVRRFDNDLNCTTSAKFEVGEMTMTVAQRGHNWKKVLTQKIYGEVTHTVDGTECDLSLENLAGQKSLYITLSPVEGALALPVKAPAGYSKVQVYLAPFAGFLNSATNVEITGNSLVIDPSELLSERIIYPMNVHNADKLYFYVQATEGSTGLSLANGYLSFQ